MYKKLAIMAGIGGGLTSDQRASTSQGTSLATRGKRGGNVKDILGQVVEFVNKYKSGGVVVVVVVGEEEEEEEEEEKRCSSCSCDSIRTDSSCEYVQEEGVRIICR